MADSSQPSASSLAPLTATEIETRRAELRAFISSIEPALRRPPAGRLRHAYLDPGAEYSGQLWDWDAYFSSVALAGVGFGHEAMRGCVDNFLDHMRADGSVPGADLNSLMLGEYRALAEILDRVRERARAEEFGRRPRSSCRPASTIAGCSRPTASERARRIADASLRLVTDDLRRSACMHEYYHPDTGEGIIHPGFVNWNLLAVTMHDRLERDTQRTSHIRDGS